MSGQSAAAVQYQLSIYAETESQAKLLGIVRKGIVLRGDTFRLKFKFRNDSSQVFPGGTFLALISYTTHQAEWARCKVPRLDLGEERWTDLAPPLTAFIEGVAFVTPDDMHDPQGNLLQVTYTDFAKDPTSVVHGIHVEARRDYHTYFALVVSMASLAILISDRVYSTLSLGAATAARYSPLLMVWYAIVIILMFFVLLTDGRDC